jgi:hypothetical protein
MKKSRKLVVMLLAAMALTLSVTTPAHADAKKSAEDWASYVCYTLNLCSGEG